MVDVTVTVGNVAASASSAIAPRMLIVIGTGGGGSPYQIKNWEDLDHIGTAPYTLDKYFIQTDDIDASLSAGGDGWLPRAITGEYDGDDYEISNLYINRPTTDNIGFTSGVAGSLKNINLVDVDITGQDNVAGLCGQSNNKRITNCTVSGEINGRDYVGGICGRFSYNTVDYCTITATIAGTGNYIGGMAGEQGKEGFSRFITFTGTSVTGANYVGGICGNLTNYYSYGLMQDCEVETTVNGVTGVGGICGTVSNTNVTNCSYIGTVTGVTNVGGLVGDSEAVGISGGTVSGVINAAGSNVGGVIGKLGGGSTIADITVTGTTLEINVSITSDNVGGIAGLSNCIYYAPGSIINCSAIVLDIEARSTIGGIVGYGRGLTIYRCNYTGNITGLNNVGGITGNARENTISQVTVQGTVTGTGDKIGGMAGEIYNDCSIHDTTLTDIIVTGQDFVGGFAGQYTTYYGGSSLFRCKVREDVEVHGRDIVGGFTGYMISSVIERCYSRASVDGRDYVGGFVGDLDSEASVTQCYSSGDVIGSRNYIGGFAGDIYKRDYWGATLVENCYSHSDVTGLRYVGGFTGYDKETDLVKVYSKGLVIGGSDVGGLVGYLQGGASSFGCYWDKQASKQKTSAMGTGRFRAEMEHEENYLGYDWELIWCMPHDND